MDIDIAKAIIDTEMNADDGFEEVTIEYFGGEPFLSFNVMKEVHEYLISKKWGKKYIAFVTTNGTLLTEEIKKWLYDHKNTLVCGLSLDGYKEIHDKNRSNSFDKIDLEFFSKTWPKQTVKMTVSDLSLPHLADSVIFAHKSGFEVSCNLAYGIDWSNKEMKEILSRELNKLIEFYLDNPEIDPCSMLSLGIERLSETNIKITKWCGAGTHMRTYDVTGERYPCQFFMPLSIGEERAEEAKNLSFVQEIPLERLDKNCRECPFVAACPNCCGYNYFSTNSLYKRDKHQCKLTQLMFAATANLKYKQYEMGILKPEGDQLYYLLNGIAITQEWLKNNENDLFN